MTDNPFNVERIRLEFPSLSPKQNPQQRVYLDSAATSQKPMRVIECIHNYYCATNANVHRGNHTLSLSVTQRFEAAREKVAAFLGASCESIIWTRGATESLNLIAQSYARNTLKEGDEILISEMEHHANIVPWQIVAEQTGAKIVKWPIKPNTAKLDMDAFERLLNHRTKIVAVAHISNVTGTRHPIETILSKAHLMGAVVVLDGAQAVMHEDVNLKQLNADFYVFSSHKIFGPEGVGVLFIKPEILKKMPPWHGGGKMIEKVSFSGTTFLSCASKFEAGTPHCAGAIALGEALDWFQSIDKKGAKEHIATLQRQFVAGICDIDDLQLIGLQEGASVVAFLIKGVHHSDVATLLDQQGIAVRSGQHCAHPFIDALGINGCLRVSIALYNNSNDIARCIQAVRKACELF